MRKETKDMLAFAESLGFVNEGLDGRDHYRVRHGNGETYRISNTPSDYRGQLNARSDLRRIAGVEHTGPNAAKYQKSDLSSGFSIDVAIRERKRFARKVAEHDRKAAEEERAAPAKPKPWSWNTDPGEVTLAAEDVAWLLMDCREKWVDAKKRADVISWAMRTHGPSLAYSARFIEEVNRAEEMARRIRWLMKVEERLD